MRLKAGLYVRHSRYGWGTIIDSDVSQTVVYFNTVGVKRLVTSVTDFAVVEHEAPKKKSDD